MTRRLSEGRRARNVGHILKRDVGTRPAQSFHDLARVVLGRDTFRALTIDRGFSADQVEDWLTDVLEAVLPAT